MKNRDKRDKISFADHIVLGDGAYGSLIVMKLRMYLDESGTHDDSEYMVIGGAVSSFPKWTMLDRKWNRTLDRLNSGDPIHAKELIKRRHNKELVEELFAHMETLVDFGLTVSVRREEFQKFYKQGPKPSAVQLDSEYGLLFGCWIETARNKARELYSNKSVSGVWVMLERSQHSGGAARVYDELVEAEKPKEDMPFRGFSLGEKDVPGLQVSDMTCYMGWRREGRGEPAFHVAPENASPRDLKTRTGEPLPVYRVHLDRHFLTGIRDRIIDAHEKRRAFAAKKHRGSTT